MMGDESERVCVCVWGGGGGAGGGVIHGNDPKIICLVVISALTPAIWTEQTEKGVCNEMCMFVCVCVFVEF